MGDLVVNPATDVEELTGLWRVEGSLQVEGLAQADLGFLQCLNRVDGALLVQNNQGLESLDGLENLQSVAVVSISSNPVLTSIEGLSGLQSVVGFGVDGNASLSSMLLPGLAEVTGMLSFGGCTSKANGLLDNASLESIGGMSGLQSVNELVVGSQSALADLGQVQALAEAGGLGSANISNNESLPYGLVQALEGFVDEVHSCGNLGEPEQNECYCRNPGG